jgi:hypothetical protein
MITFKKESWTQPISGTLAAKISEIAEKYSTYCGDCIITTGNVDHYNAARYTCIEPVNDYLAALLVRSSIDNVQDFGCMYPDGKDKPQLQLFLSEAKRDFLDINYRYL